MKRKIKLHTGAYTEVDDSKRKIMTQQEWMEEGKRRFGENFMKYESCLIYIPDKVFEEHFVKKNVYDQYAKLGDLLYINANGNLGSYTIENITGDGHYVTLQLERI